MALYYSKIKIHQYEVDLKNKPLDMLKASPKGTVPVLIVKNDEVIDESMDIIFWALNQSDPDNWLNPMLKDKQELLIDANDFQFKPILDKYKYSQNDRDYYKDEAKVYLNQLNTLLMNHRYLLADQISLVDIAVFPFIRQFCMVDPQWFAHSEYKNLHEWLHFFLNSKLFLQIMKKPAKS